MNKAIAIAVSVLALSFNLHAGCPLRGAQYLETGSEQSALTAADFNHDGFPDLALAGTDSGVVRIFLNQGDGSFVISGEKRLKPEPILISSADFNGDLSPDLAVATRNSIVILINDGTGKFKVSQYVRVPGAIAMTAGDWNSDSVADLAVLRRSGTESVITVYRNAGSSFEVAQTMAVKSGTDLIAVKLGSGPAADLVASSDRGTITVFKGNGSGHFQEMPAIQTVPGAAHLAAGFVNGDSRADLVVAGSHGDAAVLLGRNESEFQRIPLSTGSEIQGLALSDFNDDRHTDLLLINRNSRASIYSGNGQGKFQFARGFAYGLFTGPVLTADLNKDSKSDLIAAERGAAGVFLRNGEFSFATGARTVLDRGGNLFAGDFDGDGNADLLVSGSDGSLLLRGKGDGTFAPPQRTTLPQIGYGTIVDFNGDGKADLAGFDRLNLKAWLSSDAVQFNQTSSVPLYVDPPVQSLDMNGDGLPDLAVVTPNSLRVFLGNGDGTFTTQPPVSVGYPHSGTLADLNGDGIPDIATISDGDKNRLFTYLGAPNLTFQSRTEIPLEGCPGKISAGDANGDGKTDLVIGSTCDGKLTLLLGDGQGGFAAGMQVPAGGGSLFPHFVDFDNDGKSEILALAESIGKPSVTLAPGFKDYRLLGPYYWDHIAVADFDHDGYPDLAVSSYNSTAVFLNCH